MQIPQKAEHEFVFPPPMQGFYDPDCSVYVVQGTDRLPAKMAIQRVVPTKLQAWRIYVNDLPIGAVLAAGNPKAGRLRAS